MIKKEIAKAGKYLKESVDNDKRYAIEFDFHNVDGCVICDHDRGVKYARTLKQAEYIFDKLVKISKSYDRSLISIGFPSFLGDSLIDIYDTFKIYSNGKLIKDQKPDRIVEEDWRDDADIEDFFSDYNDRIDQIIRGYRNMINKYSDHRKEILSDLANLRNKLSDAYDQLKSREVEAVTKDARLIESSKAEANKYLNESIKNSRYIKSDRRYSRSDVRR